MKRTVLKAFSLAFLLLFPTYSFASDSVATLYAVKGIVEIRRAGSPDWIAAKKGDLLAIKDEVKTGNGARAGLKFSGGKLVRLKSLSKLRIEPPRKKAEGGIMNLITGALHLFSRESSEFPVVKTRQVSAAIRGTEIVINANKKTTTVEVIQGNVMLSNSVSSTPLSHGQKATSTKDSIPEVSVLLNPKESVQWTLSLPMLVTFSDISGTPTGQEKQAWELLENGAPAEARALFSTCCGSSSIDVPVALSYYYQGNIKEALNILKHSASSTIRDAVYSNMLLTAGNIEGAAQVLGSIDTSNSHNRSLINAQKVLLAVVNGQEELPEALEHSASQTLTGALALSYFYQARGDLHNAQTLLEQVISKEPSNSFALARLAEINLGSGNIENAEALTIKALGSPYQSEYAHTVHGFSLLSQYKTVEARKAFAKALATNSEHSMALLGTGLSKIREGSLSEGRADLEQAAALSPARGIFRSYLGKAYFEEERESMADKEYEAAILMDPHDPTPYLYRAFNSLSQNRVVDALYDVEDSIEKNNNRAVYRSSLMLDRDLAVRTTSLGEVFNQLGFQRVSQLEAMKSVNRDYTNFSAHRLLAESYQGDLFADAQFTEGLVADALSPVSLNVFQNLSGFITDASLNEYAALFDRAQHRTGIVASGTDQDDLYSGSIFQTGKSGQFGYFGGYATQYGNGRKSDGTFLREHRFDLSTQYQIDYSNRVYLQGDYRRFENSDIADDVDIEDYSLATGSLHNLGPHSTALFRVEYFNRDFTNLDMGLQRPGTLEIQGIQERALFPSTTFVLDSLDRSESQTLRYSGQYVYKQNYFSLIAGTQFLDSDIEARERGDLVSESNQILDALNRRISSAADNDLFSYSTYLYSQITPADWIGFTAGLNFSQIELTEYDVSAPFVGGVRSETALSPKFAVALYPTEQLQLRAAYFRSLGISNVADIGTLEPTIVGTFTQTFNDLPGARAETVGVGADYKIAKTAYTGIEYLYRDIERSITNVEDFSSLNLNTLSEEYSATTQTAEDTAHEHILRAYSYFVLNKTTTATIDYQRQSLFDIVRDAENKTDRLAFGMNYFDTDRWFLFGTGTWYNQQLQNNDLFEDGTENFWIFDTGVGYRIPKRHGAVRLVLRNLLDEDFRYDSGERDIIIQPDFNIAVEASFNF